MMNHDLLPIAAMERAVDIVLTSPHPTSKVAAALFGRNPKGDDYIIARTNHWPEKLEKHFGQHTRIGDSSTTIHAETSCILSAQYTKGASICVTDPFCPNCAKNIVEAGIKAVYIDHKGFIKDFAARRGSDFENMSLKIVERAGIAIFEVIRKDRIIQPIQLPPSGYRPKSENPAIIKRLNREPSPALFTQEIKAAHDHFKHDSAFCLAFSHDHTGQAYSIALSSHLSRGIKTDESPAPAHDLEQKYNYYISPLNRLLIGAHKYGHVIIPDYLYCSELPTARDLINLCAEAPTYSLHMPQHIQSSSTASDAAAIKQLCDKNLLNTTWLDI